VQHTFHSFSDWVWNHKLACTRTFSTFTRLFFHEIFNFGYIFAIFAFLDQKRHIPSMGDFINSITLLIILLNPFLLIVFLIVGINFMLKGNQAIEALRGPPEHIAGFIAMPILVGPATVSASVLMGKTLAPSLAALGVIVSVGGQWWS
jgi:hypothetical protein